MTEKVNRRPGRNVVAMRVVIHIEPGKLSDPDRFYNTSSNLFSSFVSSADFAAREVKETAEKLWGSEHDIRIEADYEEEA